jgi:hypothetical protein
MARLLSFLGIFLWPFWASFATAACDGDTCTGSRSPVLGGSGGDAFVRSCSDDEVMVGVRVRSDAWLDSIAPRCVRVSNAGVWQGSVRTLAVAGGNGGFPATRDCPRNFAVSGFSGRGSAFVDRLRLDCRPLVSQNALRRDSAPRQTALVGGRNGEAFGPFHCPGLLPVTGMHGQSGRYVDQLQLFCGR